MRSTFAVERAEMSVPPKYGLFNATPSTRTSVCAEAAPRRKRDVTVPGPPDWTTSRPGTVRRRSRSVVAFARAISAASITVAAAPRETEGSGAASAETTTSAAIFEAAGCGAGCARTGREKRSRTRERRTSGRETKGTPPFRWPRPPIEKERRARRGGGASRDFPSPGEGDADAMFLGQVSWLPDRPRPAPSRRRNRLSPISRRQWDLAGRVPGRSGGGRAGQPPASLFRPRRSRGLEDDVKERAVRLSRLSGPLPRPAPLLDRVQRVGEVGGELVQERGLFLPEHLGGARIDRQGPDDGGGTAQRA